ncbi:hypothetical protein GUITHDRAFT_118698 [Guillardia theta CCMP2712]|uniref:Methyltransferase type 11 domain-containing protein n=1 Tax=Guillardia theta (strain CCMP2712) TaxID=905079 RepID=L1IH43_GUITC|nr:hypothetical protein GUITHDRAFT_118698 [Guillardia theta CCMP2712]EKX35150.1 hypothetical protein GUITHDRAFT_118698 [Guillardia theta CCMP2712]|eukprot:XP_005822130.1 hypothetical protein GUITHDRAFT_118698 [Guillardia theta CCMP2712]
MPDLTVAVSTAYLIVPLVLGSGTRSSGWYKKMFAENMESMDDYEEGVSGMKRSLFSLMQDDQDVLEIGAGLGPNLPYFPSSIRYTAVEPNQFMHERLMEKSARFLKEPLKLVDDIRMIPSASMDVVVSTLVLCSVQNQGYPTPYNQKSFNWSKAWYSEMRRQVALADGCHADRDTLAAMQSKLLSWGRLMLQLTTLLVA